MKILLPLLFLSLFSRTLPEGTFAADVQTSFHEEQIEAPLEISLELSFPAGFSPDLSQAKKQLLASSERLFPFLLLIEERIVEENPGQAKVLYRFRPLQEGNFLLSFFSLRFSNPAGREVLLSTDPFPLQISFPAIEASPLSLVQPPVPFADTPQEFLRLWRAEAIVKDPRIQELESQQNKQIWKHQQRSWWPLLLSAAATLLILFFQPLRKWILELLMKEEKPTPEQSALLEIQAAQQKFTQEKWSAEQSFASVVDTLRHHILRTYGIRAPFQTTEELIADLRRHPTFPMLEKDRIQVFLEEADRAKFARGEIKKKQWEKVFFTAQQIFQKS